MSFLRKEDAAKAAKLGGAVVAVFGIAAWRVVGAVSPPRPTTPPVEEVAAPAATSPTNGEPAAPATKADDALIEPTRPVLGSMVDPFRTIAPAFVPRPAAQVAVRPQPLAGGPLPPAVPLPTIGGAAASAPAPMIAPVETPMHVTGILAGANATAVVAVGQETYVLRVGSQLPDGTEVASIGTTTVTLRHGGKTRILDVGN